MTYNGQDRVILDGEEIKFEDGAEVSVKCEVHGSNPQPDVSVMLGEGELDNIQTFPSHELLPVKGDALGQVRSVWQVTGKVKNIVLNHQDAADQTLSCQAAVGDSDPFTIGFVIKMDGR